MKSEDKVEMFIDKLLKLLHIKVNQKTKKLFAQIFKFFIVGVTATVIDFAFLYVFKDLFKFPLILSNTLSFCISVIYNYIASVKWVFDVNSEKNKKKQLIEFILFSVIGLILNDLIMWVCVYKFSIHSLISKVIATAIVMVFNFITRKMFLE